MSKLAEFSGEQLAFLSSAIAAGISKGMDDDDINILSSIFSAIGDNLGIIASRNAAAESRNSETAESRN